MSDAPRQTPRHAQVRSALLVVLIYGVFAALWILLSDRVVEALISDPALIIQASTIKGWFFVAITTLLLYLLVKRLLSQQAATSQYVIDDLRAKQHALDLLSTVVDNTEDAIYAQDDEGRYLLFNRAACEFMGKSVLEVLGNSDRALFPPEQADALTMINRRIMSTGNPETIEGLFDTAAGKRYFIVSKRPLRDQNDKVIGTFGIARDTTDRKQAEDILATSEARLRTLTQNIPGAVYRCELKAPWRVTLMSEGVDALSGHGAEEFVRQESPLHWGGIVVADDLARLEQEVDAAVRTRQPYSLIYRIRHARGHVCWVLEHGRATYDAAGDPQFLDGVIFDITERKQREEQLNERNAELERFNQAMIGRELDIIEMKKRINAMSLELGRAPPYALDFLEPAEKQDRSIR